MTTFGKAMDSAFKRLAVQQACTHHQFGEPLEVHFGTPKRPQVSWDVRCAICGCRVSRSTLAQLNAEVLSQ